MSSERVAIFMKSYLGDAVMATPLIDLLAASGREVTVVTSEAARQVLRSPHRPFEFLPLRRLANPRELLRQARELRAIGPGLILLVNRSFRSALAAKMAKIPVRIGHDTEARGWLLTRRVRYDEGRFEAECYLQLGAAAGLDISKAPGPSIFVTSEERAAGLSMLEGATIAVQPGARYPEKQIPLDVMAKVVGALQGEGGTVAMLGGEDEVQAGLALASRLGGSAVNLIGKCTIRETLGVLANLRLTVGADTGLMHLAVGAGCPTVTVFGPNSAAKWGHYRAPHRVLLAEEGNMASVSARSIIDASAEALRAV